MLRTALLMTCAILAGSAAIAQDQYPTEIVFDDYGAIEMSLTGVAGDPESGKAIMTTRSQGNCVACHEATALKFAPFHGEVGPMLDGAGDRWTEAELRGIIADAKRTFEGSVMPSFYKVGTFVRPGDAYTGKAAKEINPILTAQQIEDVVAYLVTMTEE